MRLTVIVFICEGCGITTHATGRDEIPQHGLCALCEWLCEYVPSELIMEARRRAEPGGWTPERRLRGIRASYRDRRYPERTCDRCGDRYQGPAVYCSLACAVADA